MPGRIRIVSQWPETDKGVEEGGNMGGTVGTIVIICLPADAGAAMDHEIR